MNHENGKNSRFTVPIPETGTKRDGFGQKLVSGEGLDGNAAEAQYPILESTVWLKPGSYLVLAQRLIFFYQTRIIPSSCSKTEHELKPILRK